MYPCLLIAYSTPSLFLDTNSFRFNDLIIEENPVAQKAISRLPEDELYARNFRMITAHQCALSHQLLPASKAVKPEEDTHYLIPYLLEAEKEAFEKKELDNIEV